MFCIDSSSAQIMKNMKHAVRLNECHIEPGTIRLQNLTIREINVLKSTPNTARTWVHYGGRPL